MKRRLAPPSTTSDSPHHGPESQRMQPLNGCGGQCQTVQGKMAMRRTHRNAGSDDQCSAQDLVGGCRCRLWQANDTVGLRAASASTDLGAGQGVQTKKAGNRGPDNADPLAGDKGLTGSRVACKEQRTRTLAGPELGKSITRRKTRIRLD